MLSENARALDKQAIAKDLEALLASVNNQIPQYEQLDFVVVVRDPWMIDNGFLTPTMKIKRGAVEAAYAARSGGWYSQKSKVIFE